VVVRSQQPDVENKKEERINFDIPQQVGTQPVSFPDDDGRRVERMFSNLNEVSLKHEPGSLVSAVLLIAGTTVGAGILAIPSVTQESGFLASSVACIACWLYMVGSGLLVAEVNVNTMCELGSGGVSLVSMAERTLGKAGVRVACGAYLFIHYALLVAYIARSSDIVTNAIGSPQWLSAALFTGSLGGLCYFGSQRVIGVVNGGLVVGILGSFGLLVAVGSTGLDFNSLLRANWAAVPHSIPVIALAFVYQNVVPVVTTSLEGDLPRIRTAVVLGTGIPLVLFLIWNAVILGTSSSLEDASGAVQAIADPLLRLRSASGIVGPTVEVFSFLAVATSFIGFVLGLSDFLYDLLKLPGGGRRSPLPYLLTLVPPLFLSLTSPEIFYQALDFAGTYGVLVLFGILPAAMAWSERYSGTCLPPATKPIVPGGRITLALFMGAAGYVITSEAVSKLVP
jgi:tyrosine-specific transport protein